MMVLDTVIYLFLAWYAEQVLPTWLREFGVPRPWYFPVTPSYWREVFNLPAAAKKGEFATSASSFHADGAGAKPRGAGRKVDPSFLQEPDADMRAKEREGKVVSVRGLRKEFATPDGVKVAVDNVDVTFYDGQIAVVLGHNGAGKTTLINMLTGLMPPTAGSATVYGKDIGTDLQSVRKDLGVCPQHDVLFPELTVQEHLQLFAAIKGMPSKEVDAAITHALKEVGLTEKRHAQSRVLSGGQKRKLSVCIALIGGSRIVFLVRAAPRAPPPPPPPPPGHRRTRACNPVPPTQDEPTSGMDPYSRRSTWQILQNARAGRVIVLTTHFMDEADILGDRITIMGEGRVQCSGT